jgi:hypothetical protein
MTVEPKGKSAVFWHGAFQLPRGDQIVLLGNFKSRVELRFGREPDRIT